MRKANQGKKGQVEEYKIGWTWSHRTEKWLRRKIWQYDSVLNFPCGKSQLGHVRVDIDPQHSPDIIADLHYPPFRNNAFECVICDPPYSLYNHFKWILKMSSIAEKKFILSSPKMVFRLKHFSRQLFATIDNIMWMRTWIFYTRKQETLDDTL